jgi:hypothetical protein
MRVIYFSPHLEALVQQSCFIKSGQLSGLILCVRQAAGEEG